jgi:probable rRNA maturation factor
MRIGTGHDFVGRGPEIGDRGSGIEVIRRKIDVSIAHDLPEIGNPASIIKRAIRETLKHERVADAQISVALVDDAHVAQLNERYLNHMGPTDVISFPLYAEGEPPVADIYIGVEQARRQAARLRIPLPEELQRLAVHGTLHVLGYDHHEGRARQRSEMWQRQEAILQKLIPS